MSSAVDFERIARVNERDDSGEHAPFAPDGDDAPAPVSMPVHTFASVLESWGADGPLVHEPTGIALLDERTGGGPVYGTRWIASGAPDAGKTALLVQIADTYARRRVAVGLLAIDEEPGDLTMRFAQRAGYSRLECEERPANLLSEMGRALADWPVRMYGPEHTIESAAADLAAFAASQGLRAAFFVDSLQTAACTAAVVSRDREMSPRELVTANAIALRSVATAHRLIAMATSEMNRAGYRDSASAETANDLATGAESRAIEYQARVLLALRSVSGESDLAEVRIAKNKHGPSWREPKDSIFLRLDRRRMTLEQTEAPERPDATEVKESRGHEELERDAARLALLLADRPGIGVNRARDELKVRHGSFAKDRMTAACAKLGDALVTVTGGNGKPSPMYLDGSKVGAAVLARLTLEQRALVAASKGAP